MGDQRVVGDGGEEPKSGIPGPADRRGAVGEGREQCTWHLSPLPGCVLGMGVALSMRVGSPEKGP